MKHPTIVLVTSGLGPSYGGIGVVAEGLLRGLERVGHIRIWKHWHAKPRWFRVPALALISLEGALVSRPSLILYEHADLARLSISVPWLRRLPYAVFLHGTEVWRELRGDRREALSRAALLMINSRTSLERARSANPWLPDVEVNWLGTSRVEGHRGARSGLVLCIGRMHRAERYKNYDAVLDAWPEILAGAPSAELVMIGDGDDRPRLARRIELEGIRSASVLGFVSQQRKLELLARARLLMHLSAGEGFGLVAIEAAAAGVPVLGLRGEVIEEILPEGKGSLLVTSTARADVARGALELLTDPLRSEQLGHAGRRWVEENLLRENFELRVAQAITRLLARG